MYLTIFHSIENHQLLHFFYDGYFRVVQPHVYGVSHHGRDVLYGYEVAGADAEGEHTGWQSYYAADIEGIKALSAHFTGPHSGYAASELHWQRIYVQIKPSGSSRSSS